jgi:hypothetical protein
MMHVSPVHARNHALVLLDLHVHLCAHVLRSPLQQTRSRPKAALNSRLVLV